MLTVGLQDIQGRRAPGVDRLLVEFYKENQDILGAHLLPVLKESLTSGSLSPCRRADLTLLPKKGSLQYIKTWSPESLLCADYKILSKTLGSKLRRAKEQVIHWD